MKVGKGYKKVPQGSNGLRLTNGDKSLAKGILKSKVSKGYLKVQGSQSVPKMVLKENKWYLKFQGSQRVPKGQRFAWGI